MTYSTKETYDKIASDFSASRKYIWPDLLPFLKDIPAEVSVLDLGCGNGRLLNGLPDKINYLGIDQSQELLNKALLLHPNKNFIVADITKEKTWHNLPAYDYIFCIAVMHHLPTYQQQVFLLKKIKKHLKPGGKVLITAWNLWQPKFLKHHLSLKSLKTKWTTKNIKHLYVPFQKQPRYHFAYTRTYLKRLLKKTKFCLKVKKSSHNYIVHN